MNRRAPILIFCLCAIAFVLGVIQLFKLRFEQGDVYPPYSSLRADPLGSMALYESLQRMPGIDVQRDYSARNKLPEPKGTTYLHLAGDPHDWRWMPESLVAEIDGFLSRGGRLVITCEPEASGSSFLSSRGTNAPPAKLKKGGKATPPEKPAKPGQPEGDDADEEDPFVKMTDLRERWGFDVDYEKLPRGLADSAEAVTVTNLSSLPLPATLDWHSATLFTSLATNWQIIYARGTNAVVMERHFGKGTVVFASDSFFVSNEALLRDRQAALLAWLVGPNQLVVFDEAHLGVIQEPGVATLMRRYRLHGVIAGLALLMGLFVWQNSFSLVPPPRPARGREFVTGRDSSAGFVNLLRRAIPAGEILKVCFEQWQKSIAGRRDLAPSRREQAKQIVADELARTGLDRNPVAAYQQVSQILKPGGAPASAKSSTSSEKA
jgi:hypothetical protein